MLRFGKTAALAVLVAVCTVAAQDVSGADGVRAVEPKVVVQVEHVQGKGDLVEISFQGDVYDEPTLKADLDQLAKSLNAAIEGYSYMAPQAPDQPTKVFFVTNNVIDPALGDYRLQPIVRSLMKGSAGKNVDSFSVRLLGQRPNAYTTLASYSSKTVALKAFYDAVAPSIEYRILVLTTDPSKVTIPPRHIPDETVQNFEDRPGDRTPLLLGLIIAAGLSAGALVYFALLGRRT